MFDISADVFAASDYLTLADAVAVNTSMKNMMVIVNSDEGHLDKSRTLQFIKRLKHNHTLELLVLGGIDEGEDDGQFNGDVEML